MPNAPALLANNDVARRRKERAEHARIVSEQRHNVEKREKGDIINDDEPRL
jgi:hypothetical protein